MDSHNMASSLTAPPMTRSEQRQIEAECVRLATAFAVYLDAQRYDDVVALFTADAVYHPRDTTFRGHGGIMSYLRSRPKHRRSRHVMSNLLIDARSPSVADGSCVLTYYVDETDLPLTQPAPLRGPNLVGDYVDRFILTDAGWRISQRIGQVLFIAADTVSSSR